jgi:hypothetical protein
MPPEAAMLDDATLLRGFEDGTLPTSAFHHREHVRVAWLYLKADPPLAALARFATGLQRFAAAHGQAGLYHETITWAYLLLIRERMERDGAGASWAEFAERNSDLLSWKPSVLARYYQPETLGSELARRVFVLPDRA